MNLPKQEDFIIYPRELKLFSFPRGSTNDFPAPSKDRNRIPGQLRFNLMFIYSNASDSQIYVFTNLVFYFFFISIFFI